MSKPLAFYSCKVAPLGHLKVTAWQQRRLHYKRGRSQGRGDTPLAIRKKDMKKNKNKKSPLVKIALRISDISILLKFPLGLPTYQVASWSIEPFGNATNVVRKLGAVPLWGGAPGSTSNTLWPGPRPPCTPSFIWIRPTVWPQYHVTERQDRQDRTGQTTVR